MGVPPCDNDGEVVDQAHLWQSSIAGHKRKLTRYFGELPDQLLVLGLG